MRTTGDGQEYMFVKSRIDIIQERVDSDLKRINPLTSIERAVSVLAFHASAQHAHLGPILGHATVLGEKGPLINCIIYCERHWHIAWLSYSDNRYLE